MLVNFQNNTFQKVLGTCARGQDAIVTENQKLKSTLFLNPFSVSEVLRASNNKKALISFSASTEAHCSSAAAAAAATVTTADTGSESSDFIQTGTM